MFLTAPETKGKTLEEMDDVFDSGLPAWKAVPKGSRLDQLQKDIEAGNLKIAAPIGGRTEKSEDVYTTAEKAIGTTTTATAN